MCPFGKICWRTPFRDYRVRTKYALMKQGVLPNMKVRPPFTALTEADRADIDQAFREHDLANPRFLPAVRAVKPSAAPPSRKRLAAVK